MTTYQAETFRNIHSGMIFTFGKTQFFVLPTFLPCFKSIPVTEHICNENTLNLVQKSFLPFASLNPNVPFKIQYWEPLNNLVYFDLEGPWEKKIRNTVFKGVVGTFSDFILSLGTCLCLNYMPFLLLDPVLQTLIFPSNPVLGRKNLTLKNQIACSVKVMTLYQAAIVYYKRPLHQTCLLLQRDIRRGKRNVPRE